MAAINPAVVMPECLGVALGLQDYAPSFSFGEALQHIENLKSTDHPCIVSNKLDTPGQCKIGDLPAEFATECGRQIEYFGDFVGDYDGEIPWQDLHDYAKTCDYKGMPAPFSLKKEPQGQYSMQVFVVKKDDGKHDILKDVILLGVKTRMDSCIQMCRGTCLVWKYGNQYRVGRLAVQCMLEKLEGYQLRYHTAVPKAGRASRKTAEWEAKDKGYKYIRDKGPRSNNANQLMEFADRESCRPESPIFGWEESRIERSLSNYAKGRANAKGLTIWVLTLRDFDPWFLNNVVKPILASTLRSFGVAWIGKTRVGKSAGSKTLAFMMSRVEIAALEQSGDVEAGDVVPTIVTAKHFDFFKAEPVTRVRPAIFDDGELATQSASILKAFLNPAEEDATLWARYTSAEFDVGSSRQVCNNAYDKAFEKELVSKWKKGMPMDVGSDDFMRLIRPSFRQVTDDEDLLAVLARTHVVVLTNKRVYFRHASEEEARVPWFTYTNPKKPDLFNQKCKAAFGEYKKDPTKPVYPAYFDEDINWSMGYVKRLLNGQDVPDLPTVSGAAIFPAADAPPAPRAAGYDAWGAHLMSAVATESSGAAPSSGPAGSAPAASTGCAVGLSDTDKAEQKRAFDLMQEQFFQMNVRDSGAQIDLTSPPRKRRTTDAAAAARSSMDTADGDFDIDEEISRFIEQDEEDRANAEAAAREEADGMTD